MSPIVGHQAGEPPAIFARDFITLVTAYLFLYLLLGNLDGPTPRLR
jgi:hypothetical protein